MNSVKNILRLTLNSKMATYALKYHLLTPRNGRMELRNPTHTPSVVVPLHAVCQHADGVGQSTNAPVPIMYVFVFRIQ
jgi:hypothetical protein